MKHLRTVFILGVCLLLSAAYAEARTFGKGPYVSFELPPERPSVLPDFEEPVPGRTAGMSLDEPWQFMQYLYDVDTTQANWTSWLNAMPVALDFCRSGMGFLATLHTVFLTTDGGRSWRNMDPFPPPYPHSSEWSVVRAPMYISGLAARPMLQAGFWADTVLISAYSVTADTASVRMIYYLGGYHLNPTRQLHATAWLTSVTSSDSMTAFAFAGMDGRLWGNDSLEEDGEWTELNSSKVFLRSGREDSLSPHETWVAGSTSIGSRIITVGSHYWVSEDNGRHWRVRTAADSLFDTAVSFCDSQHGMTGGGTVSAPPHGWVHITTNGGATWSGRVFQGPIPVRAVLMVTPQIGFAAGGNYQAGLGRVWSTTDGGQTWSPELMVGAEIRALKAVRVSSAYVNVIAAGVFPDFRGGVWRTQLYLPDSTQALILADPDTLNFGALSPGQQDTLTVTLRNAGSATDTISGIAGAGGGFRVLWPAGNVAILPGQEIPLPVVFAADSARSYSRYLQIQNIYTGRVEVFCTASVTLAAEPHTDLLPSRATLGISPNPGNASFEIRFELPRTHDIALRVYDLGGRLVETLVQGRTGAGEHVELWNAADHATGIYFVRLETPGEIVTRKLLLIK